MDLHLYAIKDINGEGFLSADDYKGFTPFLLFGSSQEAIAFIRENDKAPAAVVKFRLIKEQTTLVH